MKYIIFTFALLGMVTVSYGATKIIKKDILQREVSATVYTGTDEIDIYKYNDGNTTCYTAVSKKSVFFQMSCVK